MVNQAEIIRTIATNLLKKGPTRELISMDLYGIRYIDLKKQLLANTEYNFTDGAVTSALYTLPDKVPNIYKEKFRNGTYYYYSETYKNKVETILNSITTSEDYKELLEMIKNSEIKVGEILKKASLGKYKETTDLDIEYLRKILNLTNQLSNMLKLYESDKSFELIKQLKYKELDDLPF